MFLKHPEIAEKWAHEEENKDLPEHVKNHYKKRNRTRLD